MGIQSKLVVFLGLILIPESASAQFDFVAGLFKKFHDFGVYGTAGGFASRPDELTARGADDPPSRWGLYGVGLEAYFTLAGASEEPADTIPTRLVIDSAGGAEVSRKLTLTVSEPPDPGPPSKVSIELGIGYSEIHGFISANPDVDIRGAIRELPSVALYVVYTPEATLVPYLGFRTGLAQLHGFRAYTGETMDTLHTATGSTFQIGAAAGLAVTLGEKTAIYLEPSYTFRKVSGVEWSEVDGRVPDVLPRTLNLSTWMLSLGVQLGLPDQE